MQHKALKDVKVKDKGKVTAVFATLDVVDKDGDLIRASFFENNPPVRISAYNHASWASELPVGRGEIGVKENEAILDGQFFLDTEGGRETFTVVKNMTDLQEWSFGFDVLESQTETHDGVEINVLVKGETFEVAPVLLGAGVNTRTLDVKKRDDADPDPKTFVQEAADAHDALESLLTRAASLAEVREQDRLTAVKRAQISALDATLAEFAELRAEIVKLLAATDPAARSNVLNEFDQYDLDRLLRAA